MDKQKTPDPKTIIIADDHPLFSQGLTSILHEFTPYKVIKTVNDGKALLHTLNAMQPDMVLLDINMPKLNGIEAAEKIKKIFPEIKIIVISMYGEEVLRQLQKKTHIEGFIPKLSEGAIFTQAIKKVMEGAKIFIKQQPITESEQISDDFKNKIYLTERETEILMLVKKGLTTKTISLNLHLSIHTINTHRKNICRKLGVTSPNGLVKYVFENNL